MQTFPSVAIKAQGSLTMVMKRSLGSEGVGEANTE